MTDNKSSQPLVQETGLSNFVWTEQVDNDPFDFVTISQPSNTQNVESEIESKTTTNLESKPVASENTNEELFNKIRTLEFMLYSVEKEKDDLLLQCQELTNQIATLVYDKQNNLQQEKQLPQDSLDSQILAPQDTVATPMDLEQLHALEFVETKHCKDVTDSETTPVQEDLIQPTATYLCYETQDDQRNVDKKQEEIPSTSQIVSKEQAKITKGDLKELQNIEFEKTKPIQDSTDSGGNSRPLLEEPVQSKSTYLCFEPEKVSCSCLILNYPIYFS